MSIFCRAGPRDAPPHTPAAQACHLFSHISASVAPTLGHSAPYISFSTSRMFCRVRNLAGLVSYTALIFWNGAHGVFPLEKLSSQMAGPRAQSGSTTLLPTSARPGR